jgi:hypothetical protein
MCRIMYIAWSSTKIISTSSMEIPLINLDQFYISSYDVTPIWTIHICKHNIFTVFYKELQAYEFTIS